MSLPIAGGEALNLFSEDLHGPLTSNSSLIQKIREQLKKLFFTEGSILFVSPKDRGFSLFVYPRFKTLSIQSDRESKVHLSIELCEVSQKSLLCNYMRNTVSSVNELLMIVKTHDPLKNIILSKKDQAADSSNPLMGWIITFQQFIQFVSSLLYLYKDVTNYIQLAEEDPSIKRFKKMLESFLVQSHRDLGCNGDALRELLISQSQKLSLGLATKQAEEYLIERMREEPSYYENKLEKGLSQIILKDRLEADIARLMINVSIQDYKTRREHILQFISEHVTHSTWECILRNRSEEDLIELVKLMPRVMLREMSQDMLRSILIKMSKDDLVQIIRLLPITLLQNVLMQLCPDLLRQVFLEISEDVLKRLEDHLTEDCGLKNLQEGIEELQQIKNMHQGSEEDNIPTVPSLLSLSTTTICRSSSLSLGGAQGLGGWSYNPAYVNRLVETHLELKEDINKLGRISLDPSFKGVTPEVVFGERQLPGYSAEDDLLSLASMIPGYDNHIKHALLKNTK